MGNTPSTSKRNSHVSIRRTHSAIISASTASTLLATSPELTEQLQRQKDLNPSNSDNYVAPPAYNDAVSEKSDKKAYLRAPLRQESADDILETLREYDTVLIVDDSYSMMQENRWHDAGKALSTLAAMAEKYDVNGIDVHFLNSKQCAVGVKVC